MAHDLNTKRLARQIKARKDFLNKVVNSVTKLVREYGRVTKRDQGSSNTRVVSELRNFGNFTFETDLGQTMFGGNTIRVWYHPNKSFRKDGLDSAWDKEWQPVLNIYYQTDYKVINFDEQREWQRALFRVLKNKERIATQVKKKEGKTKTTVVQNSAINEEGNKLLKEAKKLGITLPA